MTDLDVAGDACSNFFIGRVQVPCFLIWIHKSDGGAQYASWELPGKIIGEIFLCAPKASGAERGHLRPIVAKVGPGGRL